MSVAAHAAPVQPRTRLGERAQERLACDTVLGSVKAARYIAEAKQLAGPYALTVRTPAGAQSGKATEVTLDVTSASGHRVPGVPIHLAASGATKTDGDVVTDGSGCATATLKPKAEGEVHLAAKATNLPAATLRALKHSAGAGISPSPGTAQASTDPLLRDVNRIHKGSTITVSTPQHANCTYSVTRVSEVDRPMSCDAQVPGHPNARPTKPKLTLVTCWPADGHAKRISFEASLTSAESGK